MELLNKTIVQCYLDTHKDKIAFIDDKGEVFFYRVLGDCCSNSWIEHISGLDFLLGATVLNVENTPLDLGAPILDFYHQFCKKDNEDCVEFYSWKLITNKGVFEIDYRNNSNGYYGGYVEYSDYSSKNFNKDHFTLVTEDF